MSQIKHFAGVNKQSMAYSLDKRLPENRHFRKYSLLKSNLILLTATVFLAGCATTPKETFNTEHNSYSLSIEGQLDARQKADLFESLIAADMAAHKGDHFTAMRYYLYAAELSKDPRIIELGIDAARNAKDPLGLEQAAKIWLAKDENSEEAGLLLLEAQLSLGNNEAAIETTQAMLNKIDDPEAKYDFLVQNIIGHDLRVAFTVLRGLEEREFVRKDKAPYVAAQGKFLVELSGRSNTPNHHLKQSLATVEKSLTYSPGFFPAVKLKSQILVLMRRDAEVIRYMTTLFNQSPNSSKLAIALGQLHFDLRNYKASANHLTGWLNKHPDDLEARFYQAASYYNMGQYHLSLENFKRMLGKGYEEDTVASYCGNSAININDLAQAESCFKLVTDGPFFINAKIQLAKTYAQQNYLEKALATLRDTKDLKDVDKVKLVSTEISLLNEFGSKDLARKRLDAALEIYPDDLSLLLKKITVYELNKHPKELYALLAQAKNLIEPGNNRTQFVIRAGRILRANKHFRLSIDWLDAAIKETPDSKELLYARALFKESLELYDEMIDELKYLHEKFPDDLNIKNALGYTLADAGKELEFAQRLIDEAFLGLPENAAVIDSKGWIAFRKGDLEKAEKFLLKAFEMQPSAEGAAHLGEVFWVNGKKDFAKRVLKKGLELDKENQVLQKTLKRLNINLK